jgi:hypothetical protein
VVRWRYDHNRVAALTLKVRGGVTDTRRGIATHRLAENLILCKLRQMLKNQRLVVFVCHHKEILRRDGLGKAFEGHTNKRLAVSEDVQKLLWHTLTTLWPEACTHSTCHNYAVNISFFGHNYLYFYIDCTKIKIFCNFVGLKVLKNENKVVYSSEYYNAMQLIVWLWLYCSIVGAW